MTAISSPVAVVTGASGGIGRFIALGLAQTGHHVVLACRNAARGQLLQGWIAERAPGATTELVLVDLSMLRETRRAGLEIAAAHPRLHILINNAGMFSARRMLTPEGVEMVLAVNHLAPYVFTQALEPALLAGGMSRITNVGSSMSDRARIDPADLELHRGWGMVRAYGRSKLALMMATFAQAERLRGAGITANVVHPGAVATTLIRERGAIGMAWRMMAPFLATEEQGADTPLHVALSPGWQAVTGRYVKNRAAVAPNRRALDQALVARVVDSTETIVNRVIGSGRH